MSVSVSGYVNQYYAKFSYGVSTSSRAGKDARSLSTADMHAIRSALRDLEDFDSDEEDDKALSKKVQAYVETYNHLMDSVGSYKSEDTERYLKKIKGLTKEQSGNLEEIGITLQSDGKLKVDKSKLGEASKTKVQKIFGSDSDYGASLKKHMKTIEEIARRKNLGIPLQDTKLYESVKEEINDSQVNYSI